MPKLSDTQAILLSSAAQRDSGSLLPISSTVTAPAGPLARSLATLVKHGFVEERETSDAASVHRRSGEDRFGLFITAAGKQAIGVDDSTTTAPCPAPVAPAETLPRHSKAAEVLAMLQRPGGATLLELIDATGWLPHTTRAALTGLRKKGHTVERSKREDATCYRVIA